MTTTSSSIAERVDQMHQDMATQIPGEIMAVFQTEQKSLEAAGVPDGVASIGTAMPDGDLLDAHGAKTTLAGVYSGRAAVVVLYRGAWCPYCNLTLRAYQDQLVANLDAKGVALIAISPQKPDGTLSMQETNDLTFTVVSDPGNQIAGQLGVLTAPTAEVLGAQQAIGLDLTAVNLDRTAGLPMPTVVIVDESGAIRWIDVQPNYSTRTEPSAILEALAAVI